MPDEVPVGSVVTDVEYHESTGECLTIWIRRPDGKLVSLIPVEYKICIMECPWSEPFHGGKNWERKEKTKPTKPDGYADHLSGNWDAVPDWAIQRINFLEEMIELRDKMRCPKMDELCTIVAEHSCRTVKHCYPYLCDGSCGHNEIYVSDEDKIILRRD
jgi:hypothetical protein